MMIIRSPPNEVKTHPNTKDLDAPVKIWTISEYGLDFLRILLYNGDIMRTIHQNQFRSGPT